MMAKMMMIMAVDEVGQEKGSKCEGVMMVVEMDGIWMMVMVFMVME